MNKPATAQHRQAPQAVAVAPAQSPAAVIPIAGGHRRRAFLRRLERMTPEQRLRAARKGRFTRGELTLWAAHYPEEAPLVNGEFEWIALALADLD